MLFRPAGNRVRQPVEHQRSKTGVILRKIRDVDRRRRAGRTNLTTLAVERAWARNLKRENHARKDAIEVGRRLRGILRVDQCQRVGREIARAVDCDDKDTGVASRGNIALFVNLDRGDIDDTLATRDHYVAKSELTGRQGMKEVNTQRSLALSRRVGRIIDYLEEIDAVVNVLRRKTLRRCESQQV